MPELRKDPVMDRWVVIAAERGKRPSDYRGGVVQESKDKEDCPFCPGNEEMTPPEIMALPKGSSEQNRPVWRIRVVPNKFPAISGEEIIDKRSNGIYEGLSAVGVHEVIIESPEHKLTLSRMPVDQLKEVLWMYEHRIRGVKKDKRVRQIIIFKNHGDVAGASLKHPHSQLITLPIVPPEIDGEIQGARSYYHRVRKCIYCQILQEEILTKARVISENDYFICLAPYASRFPFEFHILPRHHDPYFEDSDEHQRKALSFILSEALRRQELALKNPPYNTILRIGPVNQDNSFEDFFHWRLEIIPRLTRVAGFEWGTGILINPTSPENAAGFLRNVDLGKHL